MLRATLTLSLTLALMLLSANLNATIIRVPEQFQTITEAIDSSAYDDTVLVSPGFYHEHVEFRSYLTLASLFMTTGDSSYIDSTIISSEGTGRSCVSFRRNGVESRLIGFTLRDATTDFGGGVYVNHSNPLIDNVKIYNCTATEDGGGIHCSGASEPTIRNVLLQGNRAADGGGLSLNGGNAVVDGIRIIGNQAQNRGGGVFAQSANLTVSSFEIRGNTVDTTAEAAGGGVAITTGTMALNDGIVTSNIGKIGGGAIVSGVNVSLIANRVVFEDNYALDAGGFLFVESNPSLTFNQVTIIGNHSPHETIYLSAAGIHITNTIFRDEGDSVICLRSELDETDKIDYCMFRNLAVAITGAGSDAVRDSGHFLDSDPLFVDEENGDYQLTVNSPCIDAGDPATGRDADSTIADVGAFSYLVPNILTGTITARATGTPAPWAKVYVGDLFSAMTDENGVYKIYGIRQNPFRLRVSLRGFAELTSAEYRIEREDSLQINLQLLKPQVVVSQNDLFWDLQAKDSTVANVLIGNEGDGELTWGVHAEFYQMAWAAPMTERASIDLTAKLPRVYITGATFFEDKWYIAGDDINDNLFIWIFDADWNLVKQFPQGALNWPGVRDIETDGTWIWGADGEGIVYYNIESEALATLPAPEGLAGVRAIAWDRENSIIWAGVGHRFAGFDLGGNLVYPLVSVPELYIRNLAYWPNAPDSFNLVMVLNDSSEVWGINPASGATKYLGEMSDRRGRNYSTASVCEELDKFGAIPLVVANEIAALPGLDIRQLAPAPAWMIPVEETGNIDVGGRASIPIRLIAPDAADSVLTGRLLFDSNGLESVASIDVTLRINPNAVIERVLLPGEIALATYPNPFNDRATVKYSLQRAGQFKLTLWDANGRQAATLGEGFREAGSYSIGWSAAGLASGVYLLRLESDQKVAVVKTLLLK